MAYHVATVLTILAFAPCVLGAPMKNTQFNLRKALHHDISGSIAANTSNVEHTSNVELPFFLAQMAAECDCHFQGMCTCDAALAFMGCISDACNTGKCACQGTAHYLWACGNMSAVCPSVGLQCSATGMTTCAGTQAPTVAAPPTTAPVETQTLPPPVKKEAGWYEWIFANQLLLRIVALFVEFIPFLIVAFIYDRMRLNCQWVRMDGNKDSPGFNHHLLSCFQDIKLSLCACCCGPIRWADTLDKTKAAPGNMSSLLGYWVAVLTWLLLAASSPLLGGVSSLILLGVCTYYRQEIRAAHNFSRRGGITWAEDCCTYMWCSCCAIVQEARQIDGR